MQLCERLRQAVLAEPFCHGEKTFALTFSVGMSVLGLDPELDIEGLLRISMERLALAKKRGDTVAGSDGLISAGGAEVRPAPGAPKPATSDELFQASLTIDQAIALIKSNKSEEISSEIPKLLLQLVPLLQLGNRELNLGLGFAISAMEKRVLMILEDRALAGE